MLRCTESPGLPEGGGRRVDFSLVELIVAFTILLILTTMAVPMARYQVRRAARKRPYATICDEMRSAIDKYKDMCDQRQNSGGDPDNYCYPPTLEILVDGVKLTNTISGNGQTGKMQISAAHSERSR